MKKSRLLFIFLWVLPMLGNAQEEFRIWGNLGGTLQGKLWLVGSGEHGWVSLGETEMQAGKFEFSGKVEELTLAYILTDQQQPIASLMLENRIFTLQSGETGIDVFGGEQQRIWNEFEAVRKEVSRKQMQMEQQMKAAYAAQNQMQLQVLQEEFEKQSAEAGKRQLELLKTYKDTPAAACFVASVMEQLDYNSLKEWNSLLGEQAKISRFGQWIDKQLAALERLEIGGIAPDFKAATLNGDTVSLYGTEAKVKLLDFWASWCGPCRQENPNVRKIYTKYRAQGLEIIGISLDQKKSDWAKAIRDDKLTWIQLSDLGGWKSELARLYQVKAIPCTYLLDGENRVIAKNLRGKELQKKIEALLQEK